MLSHTVYEIITNQIKCQKFYLELKVKVKEEKNGICDFSEVYLPGNIRLCKRIHKHTQQEAWVMTLGKFCKADLPKNDTNFEI